MENISTLLLCLGTVLDKTSLRHLMLISEALLSMNGRVTMLGISRWTERGGSYRTVQRFFGKSLSWCRIQWCLIRCQLSGDDDVVLLVGDETTVTKSGKATHGLGRYFSSIYNRAVPGLSFFSVSLVSVRQRKAFPLVTEQVGKESPPKKAGKCRLKKPKGKPGRPKGRPNKNRSRPELSGHLLWMQALLRNALHLIGDSLRPVYFVYDNALAHNEGAAMLKPLNLHLISKLRCDAALWFPYEGPYSGRGAPRKYGGKVDYSRLPDTCLKDSEVTDGILTDIYQVRVRHKRFAVMLNAVIIRKTNVKTGKTAQIVLFSTDPELPWDKLIEYYRLRFQIEFTFRDAKQYWGLEDFMNTGETQVYNAANLAMFMVNLSHALRQQDVFSGMSVLDLKAWFRAGKYVRETLKQLQQTADLNFINRTVEHVARLGRIHEPVVAL